MDWQPAYRVTVDGSDITSTLVKRLSSISLTDTAGVQSDTLQMTLTDHLPFARLEIPPAGAEIRAALGYRFQLKDMGLFIADSISVQGPPDSMRIRATASIHGETPAGKTALTEQKTRSWDAGTTIGDLVSTIAGEHGLDPAASPNLAAIALPHIDQIDESDINLVTRIARDHDAIAKPGGGKLVMAKRGESLTVSGQPMPTVELTPKAVTRWSMERSLRAPAGQVIAIWHDTAAAEDVEITAGDGKPVRRLKARYATRDAAQAAADAEFRLGERAGTQVSLTLPGNPDLVAEARLSLAGFRPGVNGEWLITRVSHVIDRSGYRCDVAAEVLV